MVCQWNFHELGPAPTGGHVRNLQIIVKYPNLLAMLVLSLPQIALDLYIRWRDLAQVEFEQKIKLSMSQGSLFQFRYIFYQWGHLSLFNQLQNAGRDFDCLEIKGDFL